MFGQTEFRKVGLVFAVIRPITRIIVVTRPTSIPPPLAMDVHQPVPVHVRVGSPGLAAVLEPVVPALVGLQVPDEVVQEYDLLQFEQNLCGSLFWVSSVVQFYLNFCIFGDLP